MNKTIGRDCGLCDPVVSAHIVLSIAVISSDAWADSQANIPDSLQLALLDDQTLHFAAIDCAPSTLVAGYDGDRSRNEPPSDFRPCYFSLGRHSLTSIVESNGRPANLVHRFGAFAVTRHLFPSLYGHSPPLAIPASSAATTSHVIGQTLSLPGPRLERYRHGHGHVSHTFGVASHRWHSSPPLSRPSLPSRSPSTSSLSSTSSLPPPPISSPLPPTPFSTPSATQVSPSSPSTSAPVAIDVTRPPPSGTIVGGVVGAVAFFALLFIAWRLRRRFRVALQESAVSVELEGASRSSTECYHIAPPMIHIPFERHHTRHSTHMFGTAHPATVLPASLEGSPALTAQSSPPHAVHTMPLVVIHEDSGLRMRDGLIIDIPPAYTLY